MLRKKSRDVQSYFRLSDGGRHGTAGVHDLGYRTSLDVKILVKPAAHQFGQC
jgi:hypothetical protein